MVKRISDDEKRKILESFRSGIKKSEISRTFEVSISTVTRIINDSQKRPSQGDKIEDILERSQTGEEKHNQQTDSVRKTEVHAKGTEKQQVDSNVITLARNLSELNLNIDQVKAIIDTARKIRKNGDRMEAVSPDDNLSFPQDNDFGAINEFIEYYNQKQEMRSQLESVKSEKERHERIRNDLVDEIIDLESKLSSLAIKIGKSEQTIRRMGYLLGDAENKGKILQLKLEGMTETAAISKAFDDIVRNDRISYGSISLLNKLPMFRDLTEEESRKKILQMLDSFLLNHDEDSNITGKRLPREELLKLREDSYLLSDLMKEFENIAEQKDSIITYMQAPNIFTILAEKLSKFRESGPDPAEIIVTVETINDRIKIMEGRATNQLKTDST
ncbi:MAG: hypothetical protein ACYCSA_04110 [Thermoplasmataceae archaeon]